MILLLWVMSLPFPEGKHLMKYLLNPFVFSSPGELIVGLSLVYTFRQLERQVLNVFTMFCFVPITFPDGFNKVCLVLNICALVLRYAFMGFSGCIFESQVLTIWSIWHSFRLVRILLQ